jgi:hypothetical protein
MFDETYAQRDGLIKRNTEFPDSTNNLVLSGPHFFVATPLYKTPRKVCIVRYDYDSIDLLSISEDYLPRTNYIRLCNEDEFYNSIPKVSWQAVDDDKLARAPVTKFYRLFIRAMLNQSGERTLISSIFPHGVTHTNGIRSYVFEDIGKLVFVSGLMFSLPFDYLCKSTGKSNLHQMLDDFPIITNSKFESLISARALYLSCISKHYAELWNSNYSLQNQRDSWAKLDDRLSPHYFENLSNLWHQDCGLKGDFTRRQALIELDVLVAMAFGLTLEELQIVFRVQFSVLRQNEADTWYDGMGKIIFTSSQSISNVGIDRKFNKKNAFITGIKDGVYIDRLNGVGSDANPHTEASIPLGWEDIKNLKSGIVTKTYMDDTMPDGPHERTIEYHAPFDKCNREDDYNTVWAEFERRFNKEV